MKKLIIFALILCTSFSVYCQKNEKTNKKSEGSYIKLKFYKEIFKKKLTKKDSVNFKITDGDTLVFVKNFQKLIKEAKKNKEVSHFSESKSFVSLKQYKKHYSKTITREDTLNFHFKDNDTLVLISNKPFYKKRKRVIVPYEPKDSTFLEAYKDVVYLKYRSKENSKKRKMHLWQGDIKIFITKNVHKKVKRELKKFAKHLSKEVDSLNIKFVNKINESNYIIYGINSENDYKYKSNLKDKKITFYISWKGNQYIYDAKLQIDTRAYSNVDDLVLKSKKTFLKTLGHFSLSYKLPKESYLSLKYYVGKKFTKTDLEILKYHYSYGICKGTDLKTFEEQHKMAKETIKKEGRMNFMHIY